MARIAGLINSSLGKEEAVNIIQQMNAPQNDWNSEIACVENHCFSWSGWHEQKIKKFGNTLVLIDGFIYNKKDLSSADCECECVYELYQKNGFEETIKKINGDFVIAVYDGETLWIARDRFGTRPLFYAQTQQLFSFSSRLKSLLALPGVSKKPRDEYLAVFIASHYRYIDNKPHKSPFEDISQLPAAHLLQYKNGKVTVSRYWQLKNEHNFTASIDELAQQYRELLMDAVALRFNVAHKPAFTLSGGMDSSSVLASAVRISGKKQHAVSSVYTDKTYDESEEIQSMLEDNVEKWHSIHIQDFDLFSTIEEMLAVNGEPVATATWLSHYLLCREVKNRGFGSLFGGLGGDELNAGEYEYFFYFFADLKRQNNPILDEEIKNWAKHHDHPIFKKNHAVVQSYFDKYIDFENIGQSVANKDRMLRYQNTIHPDFFQLNELQPVMEFPFTSYMKNRTYQDITRETAPCCLRAEDRQTLAFNLDNFLPFFDHRLAEFMFQVPETYNIQNGVTKILLRNAMKGVLPEETRTRINKMGWNAPAHRWFSGKDKDKVLDLLKSQECKNRGIYNIPEIERLVEEHCEIVANNKTQENHMMFLWQFVNVEMWLRSL